MFTVLITVGKTMIEESKSVSTAFVNVADKIVGVEKSSDVKSVEMSVVVSAFSSKMVEFTLSNISSPLDSVSSLKSTEILSKSWLTVIIIDSVVVLSRESVVKISRIVVKLAINKVF